MSIRPTSEKVVRPEELFFSQESISVTFKKPREQERIDDAVDLIIQGKLSPKAFPKMNVLEFQNRLWSLDNRRLWVFKKAEVNFVTVTLVGYDFNPRFNTFVSTSPFLYSAMSRPEFFPRVRGHCKEHFPSRNFSSHPLFLSPTAEFPPVQAQSLGRPVKASKRFTRIAPLPVKITKPLSAKLTKVPTKSKQFVSNPDHGHSPTRRRSSDLVSPLGDHPKHSFALPPLPKKHGSHGPPLLYTNKRPHEPSSLLRECSLCPAKKSRASPVSQNPKAPSPILNTVNAPSQDMPVKGPDKSRLRSADAPASILKRSKPCKAASRSKPPNFRQEFHDSVRRKPKTSARKVASNGKSSLKHLHTDSVSAPETMPAFSSSEWPHAPVSLEPMQTGKVPIGHPQPGSLELKLPSPAAPISTPKFPAGKIRKSPRLAPSAASEKDKHARNYAAGELKPRLPRTPCEEWTSKAKRTLGPMVPVKENRRPSAHSDSTDYNCRDRIEFQNDVGSLSLQVLLPLKPILVQDLVEIPESMVECPVELTTDNHLLGSTFEGYRPLPDNSIAFQSVRDLDIDRSRLSFVDVPVATGSDISGHQESQPAIREGDVHFQIIQKGIVTRTERQRAGFSEMGRTAMSVCGLSIVPVKSTNDCPSAGIEVQETNRRITRSHTRKKERRNKSHSSLRSKSRYATRSLAMTTVPFNTTTMRIVPSRTTMTIVPSNTSKCKDMVCFGQTTSLLSSGDLVYVNINGEVAEIGPGGYEWRTRTARLHPRLRHIGPFKVIRKVNAYAARVELPKAYSINPVVLLSFLTKWTSPRHTFIPHKGVPMKLIPEKILYKRMIARRLKKKAIFNYLVQWKNFPVTEATWEPEEIFDKHPYLPPQTHYQTISNEARRKLPFLFRNLRA